ncbi:hypothetical protein Aduo_007664 [Ancylostoma duodenale]
MLFSDGGEDVCPTNDEDNECKEEQKLIAKHTQLGEAKKARDAGIQIIYVAVGHLVDPTHIKYNATNVAIAKEIAGKEDDYIAVGSSSRLNTVMDQVVKTLCNKEIR